MKCLQYLFLEYNIFFYKYNLSLYLRTSLQENIGITDDSFGIILI